MQWFGWCCRRSFMQWSGDGIFGHQGRFSGSATTYSSQHQACRWNMGCAQEPSWPKTWGTCLVLVSTYVFGWDHEVWILQCSTLLGTHSTMCHSHPCGRHHVCWQPQVLEWVQGETPTAFFNQLLGFGRSWNRDFIFEEKALTCGRWFGITPRQQHWEVDQGLGRKVWKADIFHNSSWLFNTDGRQLSMLGWKRCYVFQNGCGHMLVHHAWSTRCCFHGEGAFKLHSSYMSSPTISAMRHLKKLVAYLKGTSNYAVVLQQPHGGQGLHKQTNDKYWLLESFSDSDWSSDKRHRRSTSSGLHMLCGNLVYSSSRTQRVISLSSCEAELHGMVSTLCDGIFIKRCAEFVFKGSVEHILLTDSSSARQLCSRQGTGKVKHLSAKILWIQDQVRNGEIALSQISTAFNVADIGTKVLSAKRLKTLLSDIGIYDDDGANPIQAEESRGGDGRNLNQQMLQAAKTIARLALLMGLEPTTGAMGFPVDECAIDVSAGTCAPKDHDDDHSRLVYVILFVWCTAMSLLVAAAVWIGIKRIRTIEADAGHLALQVAQADTTLGEHMALLPEVQRSVGQVRNQVTETASHMDMLADSVDGIHYGLVEIGGFAQHRELTPVQRRHMFTVEQGNRVAMNAMGHAQYMSVIRHQSRGFAWAGDDTDPSPPPVAPATSTTATAATATGASSSNVWSGVVYAEGGESESERTEDHLLNPDRDMSTRQGELETSIDDLRLQLNVALAEELWSDADELQRTILMLLDHTNNQGMRNPETRVRVFQRIADSFRMMANRGMSNATVSRHRDFEDVYRSRTWQPILGKTYFALDARECEPLPVTIMLTWKPNTLQQFQWELQQSSIQSLCKTAKRCKTPHSRSFEAYFCRWDYFWQRVRAQWQWEKTVGNLGDLKLSKLRRSVKVFCFCPTSETQLHGHCTRMTRTSIETVSFSRHNMWNHMWMHSGPEVQVKRSDCQLFFRTITQFPLSNLSPSNWLVALRIAREAFSASLAWFAVVFCTLARWWLPAGFVWQARALCIFRWVCCCICVFGRLFSTGQRVDFAWQVQFFAAVCWQRNGPCPWRIWKLCNLTRCCQLLATGNVNPCMTQKQMEKGLTPDMPRWHRCRMRSTLHLLISKFLHPPHLRLYHFSVFLTSVFSYLHLHFCPFKTCVFLSKNVFFPLNSHYPTVLCY